MVNLELRGETFNLTNTPKFDNPSGSRKVNSRANSKRRHLAAVMGMASRLTRGSRLLFTGKLTAYRATTNPGRRGFVELYKA